MKNDFKMEPKGLPEFPGKSRKSHPSRPRRSHETPGIPKGPPRHPTAAKTASNNSKSHPKDLQMTPKRLQGTPLASTKASKRHPKRHSNDTPKEPKLKIENRCNRHRHSDSTDATFKQHYVENDLGPAECAERLNKAHEIEIQLIS